MSRLYVTPNELTAAPLGIDWTSIPRRGASTAEQLAEQTSICWRVSDLMDGLCNQVLRATENVEEHEGPDLRVTVRQNGVARVQLANWPVLTILSVQVKPAAAISQSWTTVTSGAYTVEHANGYVLSSAPTAAAVGPASVVTEPGWIDWFLGRRGWRVRVTYVAGWPNSQLTSDLAAGASLLPVDEITGWGVGVDGPSTTLGAIADGGLTEQVQVVSVQPQQSGALTGPGTLTLAAPTVNAHTSGVRVTAMPFDLQWAAMQLAAAQALVRGATAIGGPGQRVIMTGLDANHLIQEAEAVLARYARVI